MTRSAYPNDLPNAEWNVLRRFLRAKLGGILS